MRRALYLALALLTVAVALTLVGCNSNTRISSILQSTDRYLDKDVTIAGEVTKSYSVDLFIAEAGAYQVDDGSGKIWVISKNGVPREGQKVGLKGKVGSGLKVRGETLGAVIREIDRRIK
jgi:cytochrome c-type biogenesis protein CcmE